MTHKEWFINPTSRLILMKNGFAVVETGRWFDVWCGQHHMIGTMDLITALKYLG